MKWPKEWWLFRHIISRYNEMKEQRENDDLYKQFRAAYDKDWRSAETRALAMEVRSKFALMVSDSSTPGTDLGKAQAVEVGRHLSGITEIPDKIIISPYLRAQETLAGIAQGWPELARRIEVDERYVKVDEKLREQEHGLATLYNDRRVFFVFHPEQRELFDLEGHYRYRYPNGENIPSVRERASLEIDSVIRNYSGKRIFTIAHHLMNLSMMGEIENWDEKEFLRMDKEEKPLNCGATLYQGDSSLGENGRLIRQFYNECYYDSV